MTKRRRYRVMEACGACGRRVSDDQLASHERACPAWRRKTSETAADELQTPLEPPREPKGPTGAADS